MHIESDADIVDDYDLAIEFFVRVDYFDMSYRRMIDARVQFVTTPKDQPYGKVAVFLDVAGNRWDLLGP